PVPDAVRNGQVGTDVEELVLDALEHSAQLLRRLGREREPDVRVQLVDGAEGRDAAVELRHARAVAERRLSAVAAARVDPRQPHRLVGGARAHSQPCASARRLRPSTERAMTRRWIPLVPSYTSV